MKIFERIEKWLRLNIPITPDDKTQHQNLTEYMIWFLFLPTLIVSPVASFWVLLLINALSMAWEIRTLNKIGYTRENIDESIKDYAMTFKVTFPFALMLVYLLTIGEESKDFLQMIFFR